MNQDICLFVVGEIGYQVVKVYYFYVIQVCGCFLCQCYMFVQGEYGFFVGVGGDSQNDMVEYLCCVCYNIEMIVSNWIKCIWINCLFLYDSF